MYNRYGPHGGFLTCFDMMMMSRGMVESVHVTQGLVAAQPTLTCGDKEKEGG